MKTKNIKYFCFGLMMVVVCASAIQKAFHIFSVPHLYGVTTYTDKPKFKIEDWSSSYYQTNYEKNLEENFGFRNDLVRLNNQLDYWFFKKSNAANMVVGKNDFLYLQGYLDEYKGYNFIGKDAIKFKLQNLSKAQQFLKAHNVDLITVLAPGKASYYPEYFDRFNANRKQKTTNYNQIISNYEKYGINLIDFNKWFVQMKDTSSSKLFPQQGIHWSYYGAYLAADSIIKYIEDKRKCDLPDYVTSFETNQKANYGDEDLEHILNLIYKLPEYKMSYPKISFAKDSTKSKLKLLVVGDSFYWQIYESEIFKNAFAEETFWYYNTTIYPIEKANGKKVDDLDFLSEILKYDVIIILNAQGDYHDLSYTFTDKLLPNFSLKDKYQTEFFVKIKDQPDYYERALLISNKNKIDIDAAMNILADSLALNKMSQIQETIQSIKGNMEWYNQIVSKAEKSNRPLNEILTEDAEWFLENEKSK